MNNSDLIKYRDWFGKYTHSFFSDDIELQQHVDLKIEHSVKVCSIIIRLAEEMDLRSNRRLLAETIGLLHDVGRFSQYAKYRTFRDGISVNHGKLGAEILSHEEIFAHLPQHEQDILLNAVRFHNAYAIPDLSSHEEIFFLKLIRDADKVDIWRIFLEFHEENEIEKIAEAGLGLPDLPSYSEEAVRCLDNRQTVSHATLKTLNDFKLLQLSWVYDLNFIPAFRLLLEGDFINRLAVLLPPTDEIKKVRDAANSYARKKLDEKPAGVCG